MKLHMLVLEGDREAEKKVKNGFPRRKRGQDLPPLHNRSFYLCRILEEELKGTVIDGSGKVTVCAHNNRIYPGADRYICDRNFHISIYYLEQGQIDAIEKAADEGSEPQVLSGILREALLDIARRSGCSEDIVKKIEAAFKRMADSRFVREERIAKLSKRSKDIGLTARVCRVLSEQEGEGWHIEIVDEKGNLLRREAIGSSPGYVDRLGSRLYAKAEWRQNVFVITERFGKVVYSVSL